MNSFPQYNDNKTHTSDSNSNVMCPKSTGQLSRRGTPTSLITFQYGVDCVLSGVNLRRPAHSLCLPLPEPDSCSIDGEVVRDLSTP